MPRSSRSKPRPRKRPRPPSDDGAFPPAKAPVPRNANGTFQKGFSGQPGGDAGRARRALNLDTVREMHLAFRQGGRAAINKVMTQQPAVFLKLLVLLVPRELQIETRGGPNAMSTEAIEAAIERITAMLDARTIDVTPSAAEDVSASKD